MEPSWKFTVKLNEVRSTWLVMGNPPAGKALGPLRFVMSNCPALPGKLTSQLTYPTGTVPPHITDVKRHAARLTKTNLPLTMFLDMKTLSSS